MHDYLMSISDGDEDFFSTTEILTGRELQMKLAYYIQRQRMKLKLDGAIATLRWYSTRKNGLRARDTLAWITGETKTPVP